MQIWVKTFFNWSVISICRWFKLNCTVDFQFLPDVVRACELLVLRCFSRQITRYAVYVSFWAVIISSKQKWWVLCFIKTRLSTYSRYFKNMAVFVSWFRLITYNNINLIQNKCKRCQAVHCTIHTAKKLKILMLS